MAAQYALTRAEYELELDTTLAGSFPASDPPPWTLGASSWMDLRRVAVPAPVPAAIDVVISGRGFAGSRLANIGEVLALTAAVPLGLLLVGVPIAALVWGIANAAKWLGGAL